MNENKTALRNYVISLADDALIIGQRLCEWCRNGPFLEEDLALSNVALDFIGRAQMLYQYASELENNERSADDIAFLRTEREYKNLLIYELPIGDFANTMARQLIVDLFHVDYLQALTNSADQQLAAIAGKSIKESRYHLRRSRDWVLRLGDGTDESHRRVQNAFDYLWGYTSELFLMTDEETSLLENNIAVDKSRLMANWNTQIDQVLTQATLQRPLDEWKIVGGREGIHTEHFGHLLSELQYLQRTYPGCQW